MKKFLLGLLAALLVCSAALFAACDDGGNTGGGDGGDNTGGGNGDATTYVVNCEYSDLYKIGSRTSKASAGTAAHIEVTPAFDAVTVAAVKYNGQDCTKDAENENYYNFTMPAADVTITVETVLNPNSEDNFAKWAEDADTEGRTDDFSWQIDFDLIGNKSFAAEEITFYSMDETVIPLDALDYELNTSGSGTYTDGYILIDCDKIAVGSTQIGILIENTNTTSNAMSLLVTTVTVSDPPQVTHADTWTETVEFQPFSVETDELYIQFEDLSYDETLDAPRYQVFNDPKKWSDRDTWTMNGDGMIVVQFDYVPTHAYSVTVGYSDGTGTTVEINRTTSSAGAEYSNGKLTFEQADGSIRFSLAR